MKRFFKWTCRAIYILVALAFFAAIAIYYQGEQARVKLADAYQAPGEMVTVEGKAMHLYCTGSSETKPTVILEAGAGDFSLVWSKVQPRLAKETQVCSYDRAGFGWSQRPLGVTRSSEQMVTELHALIEAANLKGPFILVGHSYGGVNVRLFAKQYPELVKGVVLVDSVNEQQGDDTALYAQQIELALADYQFLSWLHRTNLMALSPESIPNMGLDVDVLPQYQAVFASRGQIYTMIDELKVMPASLKKARSQKLEALTVPTIVIASTQMQAHPKLSKAQQGKLKQSWHALQKELGARKHVIEYIELSDVGHYIQLERPEVVVQAANTLISLK
ncbi:Putative aminoacrylate hydrolase RutD [Vibrio stylophorae]|uniref:Aminoacrylate hydrolase RutD n=1 Tax=Vibrio stylophorae TaxID=659351 RepID=A0ABM8ZTC0_9VIBR|nr:alpha/beta hydrolase [Vibrio stylophorae]CAH0533541.1 Putative aminoacrylate hydrolase RutD [Vibrio stylophorae]